MRIFSRYKGIKGFVTVYERAIRFAYMITEIALKRCRILAFWEKHGLEATMEAFKVKRRTLFNWKSILNKGGGKIESLNNKKRTPINKRKRLWNSQILEEIKRLRDEHPNLGADKIHPLLLDFCDYKGIQKCPKSSTIERLIHDLGGLRKVPIRITGTGRIVKRNRNKVLRKPKEFKALYPGHCIALDTIEKQKNGHRMYVLTIIDVFTRTTFAIGTKSHSSRTFAHFFFVIKDLFPYKIINVLTDNGSEFKKYFIQFLKSNSITHYHTYPKTPKMNPHCERFNRTIQEEFVDYNVDLLFDDVTSFNKKLSEYLMFYNTKRVHFAFKNKLTPLAVLNGSKYYQSKLPVECKNGWGYTKVCFFCGLC
jgi:transposase InsO family protein